MHQEIDEDNQATLLVAKKGFSPKLRRVQRTHKVNLACIAEQLENENISREYVKTDMQSADIFRKALPPNKWDHARRLLGIRVDLPDKLEDVREKISAKTAAFKKKACCEHARCPNLRERSQSRRGSVLLRSRVSPPLRKLCFPLCPKPTLNQP